MSTTPGDEGDKPKDAVHKDGREQGAKMVAEPDPSAASSQSESPTKHAKAQMISGTTATSVAALRRSGLRFTDVDDPNALRVQIPEPGDILFGRGRGFQEHPGNQRMLKIISKHKQAYKCQKRNKKREFVEAVYDEITKDSSRFLKKLEGENCWVEVSIPISLEKVSHTLRGKRKGEEALSQSSAEKDGSDELMDLQKRRKADIPTGVAGMGKLGPSNNWMNQGGTMGTSLLQAPGIPMAPASMASTSTTSSMQNPSQPLLAQGQFGGVSQLLPPNVAAMPSLPQGLAALGGFPSAALSAYANPFMLGAASSLYGMPQMAGGSNALLGAGSPGVSASLFGGGISPLAGGGDPNLATGLARLLQQQQMMNASVGSMNPLLASQNQTLASSVLGGTMPSTPNATTTDGQLSSHPADVAGEGGLDTSANIANLTDEKI